MVEFIDLHKHITILQFIVIRHNTIFVVKMCCQKIGSSNTKCKLRMYI